MKQTFSLQYIKMKKTFDRYHEIATLFEEDKLGEEDIISYRRFTNVIFDKNIKFYSFDNVEFINCTFKCNITSTVFHNVKFERCEMSNITLDKCSIQKSLFLSCRMVGLNFIDSSIKKTDIKDSNMMLFNMSSSSLKDTTLESIKLTTATFTKTEFENIELLDVDFTSSEFYTTSLAGVDFRESIISDILVEPDMLRGIIVNNVQALDFINLLGIIIK